MRLPKALKTLGLAFGISAATLGYSKEVQASQPSIETSADSASATTETVRFGVLEALSSPQKETPKAPGKGLLHGYADVPGTIFTPAEAPDTVMELDLSDLEFIDEMLVEGEGKGKGKGEEGARNSSDKNNANASTPVEEGGNQNTTSSPEQGESDGALGATGSAEVIPSTPEIAEEPIDTEALFDAPAVKTPPARAQQALNIPQFNPVVPTINPPLPLPERPNTPPPMPALLKRRADEEALDYILEDGIDLEALFEPLELIDNYPKADQPLQIPQFNLPELRNPLPLRAPFINAIGDRPTVKESGAILSKILDRDLFSEPRPDLSYQNTPATSQPLEANMLSKEELDGLFDDTTPSTESERVPSLETKTENTPESANKVTKQYIRGAKTLVAALDFYLKEEASVNEEDRLEQIEFYESRIEAIESNPNDPQRLAKIKAIFNELNAINSFFSTPNKLRDAVSEALNVNLPIPNPPQSGASLHAVPDLIGGDQTADLEAGKGGDVISLAERRQQTGS